MDPPSSPATRGRRRATAEPGRGRAPFSFSELPWLRIGIALLLLAALGAFLYHEFDVETVRRHAALLPVWAAAALLAVLPLVGFPVNLLHVAAGMRFGGLPALGVVAASIAVQLVVSYLVVRRWRSWFEQARWLARLRRRIPQGAHAGVSVFTALLPGAPYAAVCYTLPLLGVPLRTILLCTLPIHVLRSTVTIALGDQLGQLNATRLLVLAAYALAILAASWWMFRRLNAQLANPPPAADDRRRPA